MGQVGLRSSRPVAHASRRHSFGIVGAARILLGLAAAVWLALALTVPYAVSRPRDEWTFATLGVALGLCVCVALAPKRPGLVGVCVGILSLAVLVALAVPDDDTRHLRQLLLAGAYIQHEPGRERYAFQPVHDWGWPTFVVAASVAATFGASVILLGERLRRGRPARLRRRWRR